MINPLNLHYSFTTPASIHDEEALTALELAGRQGAKINEVVADQNALQVQTTNRLNNQDTKLTNFKNTTIPNEVANEVQEQINNGTFSRAINMYLGNLSNRLDVLMSNPTSEGVTLDSEVIDIRTDYTGFGHTVAGNAVRWASDSLNERTKAIDRGLYYYTHHWESGSISTDTGANISLSTRIRTAEYSSVPPSKNVYFTLATGYKFYICEYAYSNGSYNFLRSTAIGTGRTWFTFSTAYVFSGDCTHYRLVMADSADSANLPVSTYINLTMCRPLDYKKIVDSLNGVKSHIVKSHTLIDHSTNEGTSPVSVNRRWFVSEIVPAYSYVRTIQYRTNKTRDGIIIELWSKNNDTLTLLRRVSNTAVAGQIVTATLDLYTPTELMISIYDPTASVVFDGEATGSKLLNSPDLTSSNLSYNSLSIFANMCLCCTINYDTYNLTETTPYILRVGDGMPYTEIQEALDDISDNTKTYLIVVYPRATPYKRFSMIRKLTDVYPWEGTTVRNISIVGTDKAHCIVKETTGEYSNPPCEAICNGVIRNLTFISTHDTPITNPAKGGYACHIDSRTLNDVGYNMTFDNCDFISYQAPAVGIGLHKNCTLKFKGCEFYNLGSVDYQPNTDYKNLVDYGGIFAHTSSLSTATNQKLIFDNCRVTSTANKGLWVAKAGEYNPATADFTITAYNNIINMLNGGKRAHVDSVLTIDTSSFGNNASVLNVSEVSD